jgi:hypothetical protein
MTGTESFARGDIPATNPRFPAENLSTNLQPVESLKALANDKGCSPAQLALAWLLAQPLDVVPIPGTRRGSRPESRYVGTPLRVGRSSTVGEARAIGGDGEVAIIARLTAYLG